MVAFTKDNSIFGQSNWKQASTRVSNATPKANTQKPRSGLALGGILGYIEAMKTGASTRTECNKVTHFVILWACFVVSISVLPATVTAGALPTEFSALSDQEREQVKKGTLTAEMIEVELTTLELQTLELSCDRRTIILRIQLAELYWEEHDLKQAGPNIELRRIVAGNACQSWILCASKLSTRSVSYLPHKGSIKFHIPMASYAMHWQAATDLNGAKARLVRYSLGRLHAWLTRWAMRRAVTCISGRYGFSQARIQATALKLQSRFGS
ncbi:MAG: hypothetical protein IPK53_04475 [bacterium]|nr:hypothetical protein [bacterium]